MEQGAATPGSWGARELPGPGFRGGGALGSALGGIKFCSCHPRVGLRDRTDPARTRRKPGPERTRAPPRLRQQVAPRPFGGRAARVWPVWHESGVRGAGVRGAGSARATLMLRPVSGPPDLIHLREEGGSPLRGEPVRRPPSGPAAKGHRGSGRSARSQAQLHSRSPPQPQFPW